MKHAGDDDDARACVYIYIYIATYICYVCIIYLFVSLQVHSMREHTRVVHRLRVCRDRPVDCCERGGKIHEMRVAAHFGIQTPSLGCWLVLLLRCSSVRRSCIGASVGCTTRREWEEFTKQVFSWSKGL